jgi:hypothetical protein
MPITITIIIITITTAKPKIKPKWAKYSNKYSANCSCETMAMFLRTPV